jgi:hypothetical protein
MIDNLYSLNSILNNLRTSYSYSTSHPIYTLSWHGGMVPRHRTNFFKYTVAFLSLNSGSVHSYYFIQEGYLLLEGFT